MVYQKNNIERNIDKKETLGVSVISLTIDAIAHPFLIIETDYLDVSPSPTDAEYNAITMEFAQEED